jgi:hypothetical protein
MNFVTRQEIACSYRYGSRKVGLDRYSPGRTTTMAGSRMAVPWQWSIGGV